MNALLIALAAMIAADEPAADTSKLRGTVKNDQGQPQANVVVYALSFSTSGRPQTPVTARTNDQGEFELAVQRGAPRAPVVVSPLKHGFFAEEARLVGRPTAPQGHIDFVLRPAKTRTITILDPDDKPVAGALVTVLSASEGSPPRGGVHFQSPVDGFAFQTDEQGKMAIDIIPSDDARVSISVATKTWGVQRTILEPGVTEATVRLLPVGSLAGRLTAPDGLSAADVEVRVSTRPSGDRPTTADRFAGGIATVRTDADGKFAVPILAAGLARVQVMLDPSRPLRFPSDGTPPGDPTVSIEAGQQAQIEIKLEQAVQIKPEQAVRNRAEQAARVTGLVVEAETGQPIQGVKVSLEGNFDREQIATTDETGRYSLYSDGRASRIQVVEAPPPLYLTGIPTANFGRKDPKTGVTEMPVIELHRGKRREGTVVDETGKPVARAWVTARWSVRSGLLSTNPTRSAQTDAAGHFVLEKVAASGELRLRADSSDRAGADYTIVPAESDDPIQIAITPDAMAAVAGRVVTNQGKPVFGANVHVHIGFRQRTDRLVAITQEDRVDADLVTDKEGRFQTPLVPRNLEPPPLLPPSGRVPTRAGPRERESYSITITAPGYLRLQTSVTVGPTGNPIVIPDIVLQREGGVIGRMVDREGKPVEGVALRADGSDDRRPAQTKSGADGRFALRSLHPDARVVFASHADYVFTGAALAADGSNVTIVLSRPAEAALDSPLLPVQRTKEERSAAISRLFVPLYDKLDGNARTDAFIRGQILTYLAPHNPRFVEEKLPDVSNAGTKVEILKLLGKTDDALAAIGEFGPGRPKVEALIDLAASDPGRGHELLGEAAVQARTLVVPDDRLRMAMRIAAGLAKLGKRGEAQGIIDANLPAIELEPSALRGQLAETVALIDTDRALKLCEGDKDDRALSSHRHNIAKRLASIDPARAEAIYHELASRPSPVQLAYYMASVDLPRARRLVDATDTSPVLGFDLRANAYAVMALAIADKDAATAHKLLREAFDMAVKPGAGPSQSNRYLFGFAAALVQLSERIDPASTREYFWRTVGIARGNVLGNRPLVFGREEKIDADAELALLLARYGQHAEVVARIMEPIFASQGPGGSVRRQPIEVAALALTDSERAIEWLFRYKAAAGERDLTRQIIDVMAVALAGDDRPWITWGQFQTGMSHPAGMYWLPGQREPGE